MRRTAILAALSDRRGPIDPSCSPPRPVCGRSSGAQPGDFRLSDTDFKTPWYADGLQFTCTQCGNCCGGAPGYVWVSRAEIESLAALLNLSVDAFRERHLRRSRGFYSLKELANGDCEFLRRDPDGKRRCGVYGARPLQCRTWPFWKSNVNSREAWSAAARGCPGMNTGEHHPLPVIQTALEANEAARLPL